MTGDENDKIVIMERADWLVRNSESIVYPDGVCDSEDLDYDGDSS
jgi:hypothetical protein